MLASPCKICTSLNMLSRVFMHRIEDSFADYELLLIFLAAAKEQRMLCQKVASAMKLNFIQDISDGLSFYDIFTQQNQHNFKVPKFVFFFMHGDKTPLITLRTGNKTVTLGMRQR
ncbi:uncharacterized protein [Coffea arabica]|uniref:Uncharacterized protein n=1 Tax=Coffea arabica TaxID=13443 RepID=A0ABM4X7V1_COFAR